MAADVEDRPLPTPTPSPSLWRNRDFLLLWSGQVVSILGTQVSSLALPLLALALLHSPAQAGLIAAARSVPYLLFSLPAGALIDRWDRKKAMIRCDLARFLVYGSIPLAYALGHLTVAQLYLVALVEGTAFVFFNIAEVSCLPRVAPAEQLARANAFNASGEAVSFLVGPGLGGFIVGLARTTVSGAMLAYLIDAVSYLISVASLGSIRTPFQGTRVAEADRSLRREIAEGLRFLWRHRRLRAMALLCMGTNVFFSPIFLAIIVLAQRDFHADARGIGLIFSLSSVGGIVGAVLAPWLKARLSFGRIIIGSTVLQGVAVTLVAAAPSPALVVAGGLIAFMAAPIFNVSSISYRLALTPDALQGRVNSVFRLLALSGQPLGAALGGVLLGPLGPRVELWLIAAGITFCALAVSFTAVRSA